MEVRQKEMEVWRSVESVEGRDNKETEAGRGVRVSEWLKDTRRGRESSRLMFMKQME